MNNEPPNSEEIAALLARLEAGTLRPEDTARVGRMLRLLLKLLGLLQQKNTKIAQLQRLLFGPRTATPALEVAPQETPAGATEPAPEKTAVPESSAKRRGHGRRAATDYPGAQIVACPHRELHKGAACPCGCGGQLYEEKEAAPLLQWRGAPLLQATRYDRQVLRCSSCQQRFAAPLPTGVTMETFDATADVALALAKYGAATPWERTARLQNLCGLPLPPSVQWARCEEMADLLTPVYQALQKTAAQAETVGADDTKVRILAHEKTRRQLLAGNTNNTNKSENASNASNTSNTSNTPPKKRKKKTAEALRATKTTGIVTLTPPPAVTVLASGPQHAGERMGALLKFRAPSLPAVKQMGDASSQNWNHGAAAEVAKCWAHARRNLVELQDTFPAACAVVLKLIGALYQNEKATKEMSGAERLAYHQETSQPVLDELQTWLQLQWREKLVEPNSALGGALSYLENHWVGLTEFVRQENIPLDNNAAERALRGPVLLRKNALFFRTQHGADVGDILQSVIQTCARHGVNAWEYLLAVRRNPRAVRDHPAAWLPWTWRPASKATAALPRAA